MDPNETLRTILHTLSDKFAPDDRDRAVLAEALADLANWIYCGGFFPNPIPHDVLKQIYPD